MALFPRLPRQTDVDAGTVWETIDRLNDQWPGLRGRIVEAGPCLREHILVFVDGEKASLVSNVRQNSIVRIVPSITGG
jgi:molybdopterin converting factor small subunit